MGKELLQRKKPCDGQEGCVTVAEPQNQSCRSKGKETEKVKGKDKGKDKDGRAIEE